MIPPPRTAMVLAAGLGTRLRPITETLPKPLVEIDGRSLLDRAIDRLAEVGVERVAVNVHYKAAVITEHLRRRERPQIAISEEAELLDTGGGVLNALQHLGEAFFVVNGDVLWLDSKDSALRRLADAFDAEAMDALLLLHPTVSAVGYDGAGDYLLDAHEQPHRRREREVAPFLFAGVQLLHRRLFDGAAERAFSLVRLYDRAERAGRLHAITHDGEWFHVGTPAALAQTRARFASHRVER
jgi:MurNAc alpha-1-phosphate uridylyltransferase